MNDASDDHFAELFNPSQSPTLFHNATNKSFSPLQSPKSYNKSSTGSGINDDFGSFVSVPATDDPLNSATVPQGTITNESHFNIFGKDVKARAESNERRVMDELRAHDEDPFTWLSTSSTSDNQLEAFESSKQPYPQQTTPSNSVDAASNKSELQSDRISYALREAEQTLIDVSSPASTPPITSLRTIPRTTSDTLLHLSQNSSQHPVHSPKSPIQSASTLGRSWMSSLGLLSSPTATPASYTNASARGTHEPTQNSSPESLKNDHRLSMSPTQSSLHAIFSRASPPSSSSLFTRHSRHATDSSTHSPVHSAIMPLPSPSLSVFNTLTVLTDEPSPFAAHSYVPPSGAPGFTGDRNWNSSGFEFDVNKAGPMGGKSVELSGRKSITVPVLESKLADMIRPHLPALARLPNSWNLLYSADQHGLSLKTLYANCAPPLVVGGGGILPGSSSSNGALVVVQDADGGVFGAWIGEGVHLSHGSYYGGGDSFLWRTEKGSPDGLRVYKWTGRNDYVAFCDMDGFSFGGGNGHYGLYLDGNLIEGTTHPCPTFDNECLAHGIQKGRMIAFDAVGLEVWGIGS